MRNIIEFIRRIYIAIRSRILVFYYGRLHGGIILGQGVRIYSKILIYGPGKVSIGGGKLFFPNGEE